MHQSLKRLLAVVIVMTAFCAPSFAADDSTDDPLEPLNRMTFDINSGLDYVIIEPLAEGYHYIIPQYGQDRVHHVLLNLDEPLSFVNYLLQADFTHAGESLERFAVNTTVGVAGIWDVMGDQSSDKETGFGDTFARWGIPSGPYLVLPIVGPSDFRGGVGLLADDYGNPVSMLVRGHNFDIHNSETTLDIKYGVAVLDSRTRLLKPLDDLRKNSLDFYSTMRSVYMQRRAAHLGDKGEAAADEPQDY